MAEYIDTSRRERAPLNIWPDGVTVIADRSTTESEPQKIIPVQTCSQVLTFCRYTGTVSSCELTLWAHKHLENQDVWFKASDTGDGDALEGSSAGNEARLWDVSNYDRIGFTVSAITGGGSVEVIAEAAQVDGACK